MFQIIKYEGFQDSKHVSVIFKLWQANGSSVSKSLREERNKTTSKNNDVLLSDYHNITRGGGGLGVCVQESPCNTTE